MRVRLLDFRAWWPCEGLTLEPQADNGNDSVSESIISTETAVEPEGTRTSRRMRGKSGTPGTCLGAAPSKLTDTWPFSCVATSVPKLNWKVSADTATNEALTVEQLKSMANNERIFGDKLKG